ncbi:Predicted metal-binding protein related to the C-terminal domain of SecA [Oligella ureolytica]|uniref:Predicted metal-binding protein related to the C-terminal domain of SecA n=2 Tax=Oligella TaxID=90243 RepID=A0A378XA60_9BURK|nr:SEC-C metal-binding domain-containing protein [Oligella ureolytica]SUA50474.1 Predicted metal-binding protein related to the C-terminal domain of SecA [Oligella ureolytica]
MPLNKKARNESDVFKELEDLCQSSGYIHAIAYFCFRDNTIRYADEVKPEDVLQQFSMERLVRKEISTLIGLACKKDIDETLPSPDLMQEYVSRTDALLHELHQSMMPPMQEVFDPTKIGDDNFNPFTSGALLRESIFYGGESAYHFQYRDLAKDKYRKDSAWLIENKGYSLEQAISAILSIQALQSDKINDVFVSLIDKHPDEWTVFEAYTLSLGEIVEKSELDAEIVKNIIESFVSPIGQSDFKSLDDFNPINAYPIIKLQEDKYLLFQNYSLVEAFYETPFFWFNSDASYKNIAMRHRGEFTEEFSSRRLKRVFGEKRVFQNVDIVDDKNNKAGEIDVLVVFANRAIVLQAKSKKLTIAARKGNDLSLKDDFKKAVQDAYDQALSCSNYLNDSNYKLFDEQANEIAINREFKEIYPFCVVSDHYPALSFQARQFLEQKPTDVIKPAFVMDVFFLDVVTEMLNSPLHFLSYVNRRTLYGDKILSTHELTILSYHLKQNLWMDGEYTMMQLGDDICADLDLAMLARRDGIPGSETPDGILTKYEGTHFDKLIKDIETRDHPATIDFGFMLLTLSGDTIEMINDGISKLVELGKKDGKHHDLTLGISEGRMGLTIHCNDNSDAEAAKRLERHCELRKYDQKANQWFGVCIGASSQRLRFGVNSDFKWQQSDEMDEMTKDLPKPQSLKGKKKVNFETVTRKSKKIGRNEKCPCGSGKKYKKCCLS